MNKKIISLAIALAVAISAAAFVFNRSHPNPNGEPQPQNAGEGKSSPTASAGDPSAPVPTASSTTTTTAAATTSGGPSMPVNEEVNTSVPSKWAEVPLTKEESKSVKAMSTLLVKYLDPKMGNPDILKNEFEKAGYKPVVAKDFNQYTGKMIIVRCENPPPGTRCCHAQYFEDESKKPFLQHMSFEMRPSPDGMALASSALNAALTPKTGGKLGKAVSQTEDSAHWDLKNNYSATILKLTKAEDLKDDPFCGHELPDDIGMYKVMVEQVPDDHGDDHK